MQEAWLAALRARPDPERSGSWLNEAVRRIARGLRRSEARRGTRERIAARAEAQPRPREGGRVELLRELLDALEALEEPYRARCSCACSTTCRRARSPRAWAYPRNRAHAHQARPREAARALDAQNAHRRGEFLAALAPLALPAGWEARGGAQFSVRKRSTEC